MKGLSLGQGSGFQKNIQVFNFRVISSLVAIQLDKEVRNSSWNRTVLTHSDLQLPFCMLFIEVVVGGKKVYLTET